MHVTDRPTTSSFNTDNVTDTESQTTPNLTHLLFLFNKHNDNVTMKPTPTQTSYCNHHLFNFAFWVNNVAWILIGIGLIIFIILLIRGCCCDD